MSQEFAPIVRRRTPTFPSRMVSYFDFTKWGGGYMRIGQGPGAVRLPGGLLANMQSGAITKEPA